MNDCCGDWSAGEVGFFITYQMECFVVLKGNLFVY